MATDIEGPHALVERPPVVDLREPPERRLPGSRSGWSRSRSIRLKRADDINQLPAR